jgi:cytochrome c oxidase subunit II
LRRAGLLFGGIALIAIGILGSLVLALLFQAQTGTAYNPPAPQPSSASGVANGQQIYSTATDSSGYRIPYSGGMMMASTCAGCHGPDGHGRQTMMFTSPNITYANLTDPKGMLDPSGQRIAPYNDATLKRAITEGIDSEGNQLNWPMPRWQMPDGDLNDLISFLTTLK